MQQSCLWKQYKNWVGRCFPPPKKRKKNGILGPLNPNNRITTIFFHHYYTTIKRTIGSEVVQSNAGTVITGFTDCSFLLKSLTSKTAFHHNPAVHNGVNPGKGKHAVFLYDPVHLWGWERQTDWCAAESTLQLDGGEVWEIVPLLVRDGFESSTKCGALAFVCSRMD